MTLDEAILYAKEVSSREFNDMVHCIRCSEIHGQIAEWLEDYKRLCTEKEQDIYERAYRDGYDKGYSDGCFAGYNKAIDDFNEKAHSKCDRMISEKWNSEVAPVSWAEDYADFKDDIDEIAEQLKAGDCD